jgi:hypothetical protein
MGKVHAAIMTTERVPGLLISWHIAEETNAKICKTWSCAFDNIFEIFNVKLFVALKLLWLVLFIGSVNVATMVMERVLGLLISWHIAEETNAKICKTWSCAFDNFCRFLSVKLFSVLKLL